MTVRRRQSGGQVLFRFIDPRHSLALRRRPRAECDLIVPPPIHTRVGDLIRSGPDPKLGNQEWDLSSRSESMEAFA